MAPTQNTAPVHEFRCLFTHDLRKKKKIWHDGSLRFHTFNRRVMVYDDCKNYIGDAHWRDNGDLGEGEEIRLDKGVMVEVGEQIGQTETDLAPVILDKRRCHAPSSPLPARPSNIHPAAALPTHNTVPSRSKSLAVVLGCSQGPLGRARQPFRSPFELKQANVQPEPGAVNERPKKRTRTGSEKENVLYNSNPLRPITYVPSQLPDPLRNDLPTTASVIPARPIVVRDEVLRRPRYTSPIRLQTAKVDRAQKASRKTTDNLSDATGHSTKILKEIGSKHADSSASRRSDQVISQNTAASSSRPQRPPKSAPKVTSAPLPDDGNRLRPAREKPRRKLMYKDLLLRAKRSAVNKEKGDGRIMERRHPKDSKAGNRRRSPLPISPPREPSVYSISSEDEVPKGLSPRYQRETPTRNTPSPNSNSMDLGPQLAGPSSGALFFSEPPDYEDIAPPDSATDQIEPAFFPSSHDSPTGQNTSGNLSTSNADPQISRERSERDRRVNEPKRAPAVPEKATTTAPIDPQKPNPLPPRQNPPNQRPFRRVRSENDSFIPAPAPQPQVTALALPHQPPVTAPSTTTTSPSKLARSLSDTTHLAPNSKGAMMGPAPKSVKPASEAIFDPWSRAEAYLLFEWWPPDRDRERLVYEV